MAGVGLTKGACGGMVAVQQGKCPVVGNATLSILRRSNRASMCGFSDSGLTARFYGRAYRAAQADCPLYRKARSVVASLYVRPPEHATSGVRVHMSLRRSLMLAKQKVYLTHSQILRLLTRIVRLPHGIRRDRFFRLLMRSNAPEFIINLYQLEGLK